MFLIAALLLLTPQTESSVPQAGISDTTDLSSRIVIISADDAHRSIYTQVYPLLKRYRMTLTLGVIVDYVTGSTGSYGRPAQFMTRAEIQEMIDSCGIEIASHSLSHAWLSRLDSAEAWREIYESKLRLESLFGGPIMTFVYPYGDHNAQVRALVRQAGYRMARAVRPGRPNIWTDPYRLPQIELRRQNTLADIQRHIARNDVSIVLLHRIVQQPVAFTEWSKDDFTALIAWLARHRIQTTTLSDWYRSLWRQRIEEALNQQALANPKLSPWMLFQDVDVDAARTLQPR